MPETTCRRACAEPSVLKRPGEGAVFSAGAIYFIGTLPINGFDNPTGPVVKSVLRRFLSG